MRSSGNKIPGDLFASYKTSTDGNTEFIPLSFGFLKLEYEKHAQPYMLKFISFVLERKPDAMAVGRRLEFIWDHRGNTERVTFITVNGISGEQWYNGSAFFGNTLDIDSGGTGYYAISLEKWMSGCLDDMIHPTDKEVEERKRIDAADAAFMRRRK